MTEEPGRWTWLTPVGAVWEARFGAGTFNYRRYARTLSPLSKAGHSPEQIAAHLKVYLARTEPKFLNLAKFVETFNAYAPLQFHGPPLIDGWLSPEVEQLTRPDARRDSGSRG